MLLWGAPIDKDYIGNNRILGSKSKLGGTPGYGNYDVL